MWLHCFDQTNEFLNRKMADMPPFFFIFRQFVGRFCTMHHATYGVTTQSSRCGSQFDSYHTWSEVSEHDLISHPFLKNENVA